MKTKLIYNGIPIQVEIISGVVPLAKVAGLPPLLVRDVLWEIPSPIWLVRHLRRLEDLLGSHTQASDILGGRRITSVKQEHSFWLVTFGRVADALAVRVESLPSNQNSVHVASGQIQVSMTERWVNRL